MSSGRGVAPEVEPGISEVGLLFAQGQALATVGAGRPLGRSGLGQVRAAPPWKGGAVSGTIGAFASHIIYLRQPAWTERPWKLQRWNIATLSRLYLRIATWGECAKRPSEGASLDI